jgi:alkaline phosphatase D
MSRFTLYLGFLSVAIMAFVSCNESTAPKLLTKLPASGDNFRLSFGSCNNHLLTNLLWDDILQSEAQAFVWGGDIIYADTEDVSKIRRYYTELAALESYAQLAATMPISGTWDDHDYGLNDGGFEFSVKAQSKEALFEFLQVSADDPSRNREGVYRKQLLEHGQYSVDIYHLDTRYFRSSLTQGANGKRYQPNPYGQGTMLGKAQWQWLETQLKESTADLIIINSSIQVLSSEHPFEKWNNMPHERERLIALVDASAVPVVILSGDRHISEFSVMPPSQNRSFPLLDFTSSGLTHAYSGFSGELNPFRVNTVVSEVSFGILDVDFTNKLLTGYIVGDNAEVLESLQLEF